MVSVPISRLRITIIDAVPEVLTVLYIRRVYTALNVAVLYGLGRQLSESECLLNNCGHLPISNPSAGSKGRDSLISKG